MSGDTPAADAPPAFEAFCRRIHPRLVGLLTLQTGRPEIAEELAQDTLVRVHQRWTEVSQMDNPDAWAHRVAVNMAASWWRRSFAERRANRRSAGSAAPPHQPDEDDTLVVRALVVALPARQRTAVTLRYFAGLSVAETAVAMCCREGTVKALTHKAMTALRAHVLDPDVAEEAEHA